MTVRHYHDCQNTPPYFEHEICSNWTRTPNCRYSVGDSAQAETCDSFCTNCGRGHLHYVPCNTTLCESALHDCARHSKQTFAIPEGSAWSSQAKAMQVDELTHDYHWLLMGFEDPVKTADDLRLFRLCGKYCTSEEHLKVRACYVDVLASSR